MAVNPAVIKVAVEAANALSSEKGRKAIINTIIIVLGIILIIFTAFTGLLSGLFSLAQNSSLANHWRYYSAMISDMFDGMENEIDNDVKNEVYDFMPDFSVNLSKAAINSSFDGSSLILYDEDEISLAEDVMEDYADKLRSISSNDELQQYMLSFEDDSELTYSDISNVKFTEDSGIDNITEYPESVRTFLYYRAMEQMNDYTYTFEEITVDDKPAERQTLVVAYADGSTQTVEYTCIGGGEIYLPKFLAMFDVRQTKVFIEMEQNGGDLDEELAEVISSIPETYEDAQEYVNNKMYDTIDGRGAVNLNLAEFATLKQIIEDANMDGAVSIEVERTSDKLSITLETVGADIWREVFDISDELFDDYVEQSEMAIELALDEAGIPEEERIISLNNMVQLALFQYFEGFFELPVSSSDLKSGTNGILTQYGEVSDMHVYRYGGMIKNAPETGITLNLEENETPVYSNLLDCGSCIQDIVIYDVWDMENGNHTTESDSRIYNHSAVTLAYIISTEQFEDDYGFPFPQITDKNGNVVIDGGIVTLFVEFSCLDELADITEDDIGCSAYDVCDGEKILVGYSYDSSGSDTISGSNAWYHQSLNRTPHVCIKTSFMSGEVYVEAPQGIHTYKGISSSSGISAVAVNPRLWFKGFRTGMSDELFDTISAVQPTEQSKSTSDNETEEM